MATNTGCEYPTPDQPAERRVMALWPTAGKALGLSRNFTYRAAAAGEIPGAKKIGGKWIVFCEQFDRACAGET